MIFDHTHVDRILQQFNKYAPKLRQLIIAKGGRINEKVFPDIQESYNRVTLMKNMFNQEYFGVDTIVDVYNVLEGDSFAHFPKEIQGFYHSLKNYMNRVKSSYDFNIMNRLGKQLDPISALFIIINTSIIRDTEVYDNTTSSQEWLDHNFSYLSKIGFSSNYFYPLLKKTRDGYERFEDLELSDENLEDMATAAVVLQSMIKDAKLTPWDLDDVQVTALENNNASAESFPGYANLRNDEVKERVIQRSKRIKEEGTLDDIFPFSQLHRIQSGGNVIFDYLKLVKDETTGNYQYSKDQLISAINQIANERGYSTTYVEKQPDILPELITLVDYIQLPESYAMREQLVNAGEHPAIIMNTFKNTDVWMFNYQVDFPNVFTLIGDKYGEEFPEYSDKIYTKHRSVKASGPDFSRIVQAYLYPLMDYLGELKMTKYSSFVSQWEHPDYLKRMLTNIMAMINPDAYDGVVDHDIDIEKARTFKDKISSHFNLVLSADDKTGFDQFNFIIFLWLYFTTYFSIPFEDNDVNTRLMKMMCQQIMFPVLLTPDGVHIYDTIIPSGAGVTSSYGTYSSNLAGMTVQGGLLRDQGVGAEELKLADDDVAEYTGGGSVDVDDDEGGSVNET